MGITLFDYIIEPSRPGYVWVTRVLDGEGMEIEEAKLKAALDKFYEDNF
jgi:hypothetical protein